MGKNRTLQFRLKVSFHHGKIALKTLTRPRPQFEAEEREREWPMGGYSNRKSLSFPGSISWKLILPDDRGGKKIKNAKKNLQKSTQNYKISSKPPQNKKYITQKRLILPRKIDPSTLSLCLLSAAAEPSWAPPSSLSDLAATHWKPPVHSMASNLLSFFFFLGGGGGGQFF